LLSCLTSIEVSTPLGIDFTIVAPCFVISRGMLFMNIIQNVIWIPYKAKTTLDLNSGRKGRCPPRLSVASFSELTDANPGHHSEIGQS